MNNSMENNISTDNDSPTDERKQSPPAFLDLADSAARLGSNMTDISARVELKRIEHERQRALQRKIFEDQMRVLEHQQAQELLSLPYDPNAPTNGGIQHLAVSARLRLPVSTPSSMATTDSREKHSEWPQFHGSRGPDGLASRTDRRTVTNPNLNLSGAAVDLNGKLAGTVSASSTPLHPQGHLHVRPPSSRRGSPPSILESLNGTTRSVPATPLGISNNPLLKTPGTPLSEAPMNGRLSHQLGDNNISPSDLQASLSRISSGQYDGSGLSYHSSQGGLDDAMQSYGSGLESGFPLR
ncbi:hypothetical protein BDZ89DRAFT_385880 [Hymenopellis radicata]|nr:hypothetical protein BDZ89DRAFT_385880 [Hymenopellis radicata]